LGLLFDRTQSLQSIGCTGANFIFGTRTLVRHISVLIDCIRVGKGLGIGYCGTIGKVFYILLFSRIALYAVRCSFGNLLLSILVLFSVFFFIRVILRGRFSA
jgi:hypothetical protein